MIILTYSCQAAPASSNHQRAAAPQHRGDLAMLEFYYAPYSRSSTIHWILEELEVDYTPRRVDIQAPGGAPESYRKVHPHKKVPALVHDGVTITETPAIAIYLGDTFPKTSITPAIGDPLRGPYLSWLVYLPSVFDPALLAKIK